MDSGTLGGIGGFLRGLESQVGPYLDQQIQARSQQETADSVAIKKEVRRKVMVLRAQGGNRFDIENPTHAAAAEYAYSIGGKPPKDIAKFLAIPDAPPGVQDAFSAFLGGQGGGGMDGGGGGGAPAGAHHYVPDNRPGAPTFDPSAGNALASPEAGNVYGSPSLESGKKGIAGPAPLPQGDYLPGITPSEKLQPGQTFSYRMPGTGMTLSFKGLDLKTRDKLAIRRAAAAVKKGMPFAQAMEALPGDVGLQFAEQMALHKRNALLAAGGDFASANQAVAAEFGAVPEDFAKFRAQEGLIAERARVETSQAGPRADARNASNLKYAGPIADAKNASTLDYAGPIEEARTTARAETKALLDPNERQAVGNSIGLDMTQPLTEIQEAQLQGAMRMKKSQDTAAVATAQNQVNPQEGFLAQQAANEAQGGQASASSVLAGKQTRDVQTTEKKKAAEIKVEQEQKPVDNPSLYRDPVTLEPTEIGTTLAQAKERKLVKINQKDTGVVVNLGRLEAALQRYKKLVPELYPTDNAFANKTNFMKLRASGDARITELESFMPEITALSRASGERGQSTENDIARAASGLAKGTEFAKQKGVMKAIQNTEETIAKVRKLLGFQPKAGSAPRVGETVTEGDITIKRVR